MGAGSARTRAIRDEERDHWLGTRACVVGKEVVTVTELFNSREIAVSVWAVIFAIWALRQRPVRRSLRQVVPTALRAKVVIPVVLLLVYLLAVLLGLWVVGFWGMDLLKGTVLWFVFSGIVLPFSFVVRRDEEKILSRVVRDSVTIAVVIEFLVGTYTFPLVVELLLIPLATMTVMLKVVAEGSERHASVAKLLGAVEVVGGLLILGVAVYRAVADYQTLGTIVALRQFALPIVLSVMLCPFTYASLVYANFELLFLRVSQAEGLVRRDRRYAKVQLARHLKLNPYRARRFLRTHALALMRLGGRDDIDRLLATSELG